MIIIEKKIFKCKVDPMFSVDEFQKGYARATDRFHAKYLWAKILAKKGHIVPVNFIKTKEIKIEEEM